MCKRFSLVALFIPFSMACLSQDWAPVGGKMLTDWGANVSPEAVHTEYPRPQLERTGNWQNLNGLWQYSVTHKDQTSIPVSWQGDILVPFAIESALSGVGKRVSKEEALWYHRQIDIADHVRKDRVLLHFGAVDWQCDVYINGQPIGRHEGGFDPFTFDITDNLKKGKRQTLSLRVWDPTELGPQPRGKQVSNPHGIWYTPVTGIWQTVWLEGVGSTYIESTRQTPDIDTKRLLFTASVIGQTQKDELLIQAFDGEKKLTESKIPVGASAELVFEHFERWSPDNPKLYDLRIKLVRNGKTVDEVSSYFAMRKISMGKDEHGIQRMLLNNEFVFQYGPLDQGWWPDGLHTAPSDAALKFDIVKTKEMGFNMIRKHIKVEPARWYRHCDSIGMLVWQDMPSGDLGGNVWDMTAGQISGGQHEKNRSPESEAIFRLEWERIMQRLHNFPSIVMWVPFNEAWGQFKTEEIIRWTISMDPSRLINSASGGNFDYSGHILDIHNYPDPVMPDPRLFGDKLILALGEFGGLGLPVEGHTWQEKDNWGYQTFTNKEELANRYRRLVSDLGKLVAKGLSAAVYTQTTDVEVETNGLMTYDRKVTKINEQDLKLWHDELIKEK